MKLNWNTCFKVACSIFVLYLGIRYWDAAANLISLAVGAAMPLIIGGVIAYVVNISDADLPILSVSIDEVQFPLCQPYEESLSYALTLLNNEDGTPTDVDIDELASEVYQYLWWHLAEG